MKIIFMGTPDFALPTLKALVENKYDVKAVYTAPPKEAGRGHKITKSPIHQYADMTGIEVCSPASLRKDPSEFEKFERFEADIVVLVAYGLIIPQKYLDAPKYGFLNIHPSKLPRHRGASPLQRTILEGDKETSVCIMQMDQGLDTGDILYQKDIELPSDITIAKLHDDLSILGGNMMIEVLTHFDNYSPKKQSDIGITYANKITKEDGKINFQIDNINIIDRKIRALNPWPGSYFLYQNEQIKIIEASIIKENHQLPFGKVSHSPFMIACIGGFLMPKLMQRSGKNKMPTEEFLRGFPISESEII